jgi:hypothetical protein
MSDWHQDGLAAGRRCLNAAADYLGRGWAPLALCPPDHVGVGRDHGKTCFCPGKAPVIRWKEYQVRLPTSDELRQWWGQQPNANVGIAMGPVSGLVGVDADGPSGETQLSAVSGGDLPDTLEFDTSKGRRLLYAIPPGVTLVTTFKALAVAEELRLLGQGAQTVAPPSRHLSGRDYCWVVGRSPDEIAPAPAPAWLVQAMSPGARSDDAPADPLFDGEAIPDGRRNTVLTSMAGTMRKRGFSGEAIRQALLVENERCAPPLGLDEVEKIARSVARYSPDQFAGVTIKMSGVDGNGDGFAGAAAQTPTFPEPTPLSLLRRITEIQRWVWDGYLARGTITLLSALWKAGKTTLLSYLLKALEEDGTFCGRPCRSCRVLLVTEEHETLWATRRDNIGLTDNAHVIVRPFASRPDAKRWQEFMGHLRDVRLRFPFDLLVMDPLSNLWPVKDENDANNVQNALLPLHSIGDDLATLLVHHLRKGDGTEATAARGSGALPAFCDTLLELRRYDPVNRKDCRRVLTGYGRFEETPAEVVVEWTRDGYLSRGDKSDASFDEVQQRCQGVLPAGPPGLTREEVQEALREDNERLAPGLTRVGQALHAGAERGLWVETGNGKRAHPYRYYLADQAARVSPEDED